MTFEEAVRKAIRQYYDNKGFDKVNEMSPDKPFKYNKKFFDDIESPSDESEMLEGEEEIEDGETTD